MKRTMALMTALIMVFTLAAAVLAEDSNILVQVVNDCEKLLFNTDNVTLKGGVEFSLDGKWFKNADIVYQQEGYDAYCDLKVKSPKKDGTVKENGYTVFDDDGSVRLVEVIYPGTYKTAGNIKNNTILRSSARTELVMSMFKILASQANAFVDMTADADGKTVHLKLNGGSTEILNTGLMMLMQFAGERFFGINGDLFAEGTGKITDYATVTRGLLAATRSMALQNAEMTLKVNDKGELESAEGSASVKVNTTKDGEHVLEGRFNLTVSDRGTTKAEHFDSGKHVAPAK